ncbi:Na/Pi cotransporter family protein [Breznakia pachnodae]|uniref:Phosphate:Na+ symporter n=1 Tax=Breznakia pachnodae TaxID=265178 RepID=A0ABU0E7V7_9FIRM|nr:Na/Pi cotransporter family protein [Breznakia pachnodae]MDQ0362982.1 phosphate:Na+ symporter [Breznakia pachnodae]
MLHIATSIPSIQWDYILGGFALFLFGIEYMGAGLKSIAGDKLRDYIDKYTSKPWMGIIIGALITTFIQSSSATTAIAIGFVRAGIMKLEQAVGIIMGANIGTTITAFLIGLKVEKMSLIFVFIGVIITVFSKRKKQGYAGQIILGFGLLFFGLRLMGDELSLLGELPQFDTIATEMAQQPILGMLAGTFITAIVQSSSAVIGIVQKLYDSNSIQLIAALPLIFGSNIGTTITAVLAALGGSVAAKRTAGIHVMFNVFGTILFMIFLTPVSELIATISSGLNLSPMMEIAVAHIIFNVTVTILAYPFIKQMVMIVKKIVRGKDERQIEVDTAGLDPMLAETLPAAAINSAKNTTIKMAELVILQLEETKLFLNTKAGKHKEGAGQYEDAVNTLDSKITEYLIHISHEGLSQDDADALIANLQVIKNIERIGDISMNLVNFYDMVYDERAEFSESALADLNEMSDVVISMLDFAMAYYYEQDESLAEVVADKENYLDLIEEKARKRHFKRMANDECKEHVAASIYVDILSNLERMGDHADNIIKVLKDPAPLHEPVAGLEQN